MSSSVEGQREELRSEVGVCVCVWGGGRGGREGRGGGEGGGRGEGGGGRGEGGGGGIIVDQVFIPRSETFPSQQVSPTHQTKFVGKKAKFLSRNNKSKI